jgi:hypothetical protein
MNVQKIGQAAAPLILIPAAALVLIVFTAFLVDTLYMGFGGIVLGAGFIPALLVLSAYIVQKCWGKHAR